MSRFEIIFWPGDSAETQAPYTSLPFSSVLWNYPPSEIPHNLYRNTTMPLDLSGFECLPELAAAKFVNYDLEAAEWMGESGRVSLCDDVQLMQAHRDLYALTRECNSTARIGNYSVFPNVGSLRHRDDFAKTVAQEHRDKDYDDIKCSANYVADYLGPTWYAPYPDQNTHWGSAAAHLESMRLSNRAARLGKPGVPLYPFIWRYANGGDKGTLPDQFWIEYLELVTTLADGFFLFAYSVEEGDFPTGDEFWFTYLKAVMESMSGPLAPRRLRHETPCPAADVENLWVSFPEGNQDFATPIKLFQSCRDPAEFGVANPYSTERSFYLEPHEFGCHQTQYSETLIRVVLGGASSVDSIEVEVIANGNQVGTYLDGLGPLNREIVGSSSIDPVSGATSGDRIVISDREPQTYNVSFTGTLTIT